MKKFIDFLNETPLNIGSLENHPNKDTFIKSTLKEIDEIKQSSHNVKIFGNFKYIIKDKIFILMNTNLEVLGFVIFEKYGKRLQIKNIENISKIKGFSIICYQILLKTIADEILTGTELSKENIKAHKNMYIYFRMFLFNKGQFDETDRIESEQEIDNILKECNRNTQFLIKELFSGIVEFTKSSYNIDTTECELLLEYIQNTES